jgi:predicted  nucleic acid-binding Zn-ribbon protein
MAKTTKKPIATSKPLKTAKTIKKESIKEVEEPKKSTVKKESTKVVEKPKKSPVKKEPAKEAEKPIKFAEKKTKEIPVVESKKTVVKVTSNLNVESTEEKAELTIEKKLITLYNLQQIDSQIDKIRIIRGELPLEVQDLETRVDNYIQETVVLEKFVLEKKNAIKDSQLLIKKYEDQQMNVRNNREYDSLTKEIEFQNLEIQLSEKRIREYQQSLDAKRVEIERFQKILQDRKNDLEIKNNELEDIVAETEKEENDLIQKSEENRSYIEDRLITAYSRIRKNARNGLAVVQIERDACGGCFNKIPPQHQLDIRMHKKIIVCEYCGRILVDEGIVNVVG